MEGGGRVRDLADDTCLYFLVGALGATARRRWEGSGVRGRTSGERGQRRGVPRDGRGELEELLLVSVEDLRAWGRWGGDAVRVSTFGPVAEKRRRCE